MYPPSGDVMFRPYVKMLRLYTRSLYLSSLLGGILSILCRRAGVAITRNIDTAQLAAAGTLAVDTAPLPVIRLLLQISGERKIVVPGSPGGRRPQAMISVL